MTLRGPCSGRSRDPAIRVLRRLALPLVSSLAALLGGCGGQVVVAPAQLVDAQGEETRLPTQAELRALKRILAKAEALRNLKLRRAVRIEIHSAAAIAKHVVGTLDEDDIAQARALYGALGLIEPTLNLRELLQRVVSEQVVGYYDPSNEALVVREDVGRQLQPLPSSQQKASTPERSLLRRSSPKSPSRHAHLETPMRAVIPSEAEVVLVHEAVHALQDQHFGLEQTQGDDLDSDPANARQALIEGDATLTMLGLIAEANGFQLSWLTKNPKLLGALSGQGASPSPSTEELNAAPPILRVTLLSPYTHGLVYAASLFQQGGWRRIDGAFRDPPVSMEQVLHPVRREGLRIKTCKLPKFEELESQGYRTAIEDTLGELELGVYLGQHLDAGSNPGAATGWGCDRVRAYDHPRKPAAAVWLVRGDRAQDAERFARVARRAVAIHPRGARPSITLRGDSVLIVAGFAQSQQHLIENNVLSKAL